MIFAGVPVIDSGDLGLSFTTPCLNTWIPIAIAMMTEILRNMASLLIAKLDRFQGVRSCTITTEWD